MLVLKTLPINAKPELQKYWRSKILTSGYHLFCDFAVNCNLGRFLNSRGKKDTISIIHKLSLSITHLSIWSGYKDNANGWYDYDYDGMHRWGCKEEDKVHNLWNLVGCCTKQLAPWGHHSARTHDPTDLLKLAKCD